MKVCERSDGGEQRRDGGFDVDQLWMWCFVCAAVTPRSGRKMRKGPFWKPSLGWRFTRGPSETRRLHPPTVRIRAAARRDPTAEKTG